MVLVQTRFSNSISNIIMATFGTVNQGNGFFDELAARAKKIDSLLCVGLDPHEGELGEDVSAAGAKDFCLRLVKATSSSALAYKPNSAFFERFGVSDPVACLKYRSCHLKLF